MPLVVPGASPPSLALPQQGTKPAEAPVGATQVATNRSDVAPPQLPEARNPHAVIPAKAGIHFDVACASLVATSEDQRRSTASVRKRPGHFLCLAKESNQRKALSLFSNQEPLGAELARGCATQAIHGLGGARRTSCAPPSGSLIACGEFGAAGGAKSNGHGHAHSGFRRNDGFGGSYPTVGAARAATAPTHLRRISGGCRVRMLGGVASPRSARPTHSAAGGSLGGNRNTTPDCTSRGSGRFHSTGTWRGLGGSSSSLSGTSSASSSSSQL